MNDYSGPIVNYSESMNYAPSPEGGYFWITLALVNAGLAEQKNRSRWAWFLISLLLGPLATVMIVIWRAPVPAASALSPRSGHRDPGQ